MHPSDWNHRQAELAARLHAWRLRTYPSECEGLYVEDGELQFLESSIASMLDVAVKKGPLRPQAARSLADSLSKLRIALPHLPASGVVYYTELLSMAELALLLGDNTR